MLRAHRSVQMNRLPGGGHSHRGGRRQLQPSGRRRREFESHTVRQSSAQFIRVLLVQGHLIILREVADTAQKERQKEKGHDELPPDRHVAAQRHFRTLYNHWYFAEVAGIALGETFKALAAFLEGFADRLVEVQLVREQLLEAPNQQLQVLLAENKRMYVEVRQADEEE